MRDSYSLRLDIRCILTESPLSGNNFENRIYQMPQLAGRQASSFATKTCNHEPTQPVLYVSAALRIARPRVARPAEGCHGDGGECLQRLESSWALLRLRGTGILLPTRQWRGRAECKAQVVVFTRSEGLRWGRGARHARRVGCQRRCRWRPRSRGQGQTTTTARKRGSRK